MPVISIEEHWTTAALDRALRSDAGRERDPSIALNDHGDIPERLLDLEELRLAAMDEAGIDVQVVSLAPPGTNGMPSREAVALSREANDQVTEAIARHPTRLRALTTLPFSDPDAAVAELERSAQLPGHVGVMAYGRSGDRPLDHPDFDDVLATATRLRRPLLLHPQIPPAAVRDSSYSGIDPMVDLALASFGLGWHYEAGLAALRLIVSGAFDRHPDLQVVLGHWGELLLFALDRADSLSNVAPHLERRVREYVATNVHITCSGMLTPRLLRHALDVTTVDRILLSGDYPFHQLRAGAVDAFLAELADPDDRAKVAHGNAERLFSLDGLSQNGA